MKIVVVDTPREFEGEIDWRELLIDFKGIC